MVSICLTSRETCDILNVHRDRSILRCGQPRRRNDEDGGSPKGDAPQRKPLYNPKENTVLENVRRPLQSRLVQALGVDEKLLQPLSVIELLSLLYALWGQTNSLGAYGDTVTAFRAILGDDLLWNRPKIEAVPSEIIQ